MAATLHLERNNGGIRQHDRPHIEAVRRYGREANGACSGSYYRTAIGKAVGRRARWRGDDESVSLIGDKIFIVDACPDGNHRGMVALQHRYVVQRVWRSDLLVGIVRLYLQDGMAVHAVVLRKHIGNGGLYLRGVHIGQESQPPYVDADDGDILIAHPRRCL